MKRPFESVIEYAAENFEHSIENSKFIFEHTDKIITWLIGFSVTGIWLIISEFESSDNSHLNGSKALLYLLVLTLILGLLHRFVFFYLQIYLRNKATFFRTAFSSKKMLLPSTTEILENPDFNYILFRLKKDFNEDLDYLQNIYYDLKPEKQQVLIESITEHYQKLEAWTKRDFEAGMEFMMDTYARGFGYSKKKWKQKVEKANSNTNWQYRVLPVISISFFVLSVSSFITAIIILVYNFNPT